MPMTFRLEQRQLHCCSVCSTPLDTERARDRAIVLELFGVNIEGWIEQGNCPALHCLSTECEYPPDVIKKRWERFMRRREARKRRR